METTRRRFALISACLASRPTCSTRERRRISARVSSSSPWFWASSFSVASRPASIFMARSTSSAAVRRSTLPISFRYMRTGSPVSMTVEASMPRGRVRLRVVRTRDFFLGFSEDISASAILATLRSWSSLVSSSESPSISRSSSWFKPASSSRDASSSPAETISMPRSRRFLYREFNCASLTSMSLRAIWISSSVTVPVRSLLLRRRSTYWSRAVPGFTDFLGTSSPFITQKDTLL